MNRTKKYIKSKASCSFTGEPLDIIVSINQWINVDGTIYEILQSKGGVKVTIEKLKNKRSEAANRYYWAVLIPAFQREYPDFTKEQMHDVLGEKFRKARKTEEEIQTEKDLNCFTSEWRTVGTSEMNSYDFWEYCERLTAFLPEVGGYLDEEEYKEYSNAKGLNNG